MLLAQKEVRDRRRYTQHEIADACGVSQSMVSRMKRSHNIESITLKHIRKFAEFLSCEIGELLYMSESNEIQ